jgi:hypothetical protein
LLPDWKQKVQILNDAIASSNANIEKFMNQEFLIALGLLIGAADFSQIGKDIFAMNEKHNDTLNHIWFFLRFKNFRRFLHEIFADHSKKVADLGSSFHQHWRNLEPSIVPFL